MARDDARVLGRWGEMKAAELLRGRGYEVTAARYRSRFGELDLIAQDGVYLVFVEVKLRRDDTFAPARAFVDKHKQLRILRTAECYLAQHPTALQPRFDVVEVYAPEGTATKQPKLIHIENAF